jgi:hypothetical protein
MAPVIQKKMRQTVSCCIATSMNTSNWLKIMDIYELVNAQLTDIDLVLVRLLALNIQGHKVVSMVKAFTAVSWRGKILIGALISILSTYYKILANLTQPCRSALLPRICMNFIFSPLLVHIAPAFCLLYWLVVCIRIFLFNKRPCVVSNLTSILYV